MKESTITGKYQTTVPSEIRKSLAVGPGDVLKWELVGNRVLISAARLSFLDRQGRIKVGRRGSVEDVRKARELMGVTVR
jgi:bifunctional DNA-binding transcriptional regulator/antitoxin component of YhaV-PrlF toxin-antitoxin module